VAHFFPYLVRVAVQQLERLDEFWPYMYEWATESGVTPEMLGLAVEAITIAVIPDPAFPKDKLEDSLSRTAWWDLPWQAHAVVGTVMSAIALGFYHQGIRMAIKDSNQPLPQMDALMEAGRHAAQVLRQAGPAKSS
jgi:hypothetical protein